MGNVNMEASQINYRNNSKKSVRTVETALDNLYTKSDTTAQDIIDLTAAMTAKADKIDIAPTFSAENTYFAGDLVFQSGRLWKFVTDHTPGEWNQEEVAATNIDLALKAVDVSLPDYSETEQPTGQKWIDGKDIYFKTIPISALPNNTTVNYPSGLTGENVIHFVAAANNSGSTIQIPFVSTDNNYSIEASYNNNTHNFIIFTKYDASAVSGHVTLYYTKTE